MADITKMIPVEYQCDGFVKIRRCPHFDGAPPVVEPRAAYWYLKQPSRIWREKRGWSQSRLSEARSSMLDVAYWDGERWAESTPKEFETPEAAWEEYWAKAKADEQTPPL